MNGHPLVEPSARLALAQCDALREVTATELSSTLLPILSALPLNSLPLDDCASRGGMIDPEDWSFSALSVDRTASALSARLSLFFTEIVGGCNCHDEPSVYHGHELVVAEIDLPSGRISWRRTDA